MSWNRQGNYNGQTDNCSHFASEYENRNSVFIYLWFFNLSDIFFCCTVKSIGFLCIYRTSSQRDLIIYWTISALLYRNIWYTQILFIRIEQFHKLYTYSFVWLNKLTVEWRECQSSIFYIFKERQRFWKGTHMTHAHQQLTCHMCVIHLTRTLSRFKWLIWLTIW